MGFIALDRKCKDFCFVVVVGNAVPPLVVLFVIENKPERVNARMPHSLARSRIVFACTQTIQVPLSILAYPSSPDEKPQAPRR